MKYGNFSFWRRMFWLFVALAGVAQCGQPGPAQESFTHNPVDGEACKAQLNRIYEALMKYQKKHKRLPDWLSDLREFVDDPKTFVCPFVRSLNDFNAWRQGIREEVFSDPHLNVSYA